MSKTVKLSILAAAIAGCIVSIERDGASVPLPAEQHATHHLKPGDTITIKVLDAEAERAREIAEAETTSGRAEQAAEAAAAPPAAGADASNGPKARKA